MKLVQQGGGQLENPLMPIVIGSSSALKRVLDTAGRIAAGHAKVLIKIAQKLKRVFAEWPDCAAAGDA